MLRLCLLASLIVLTGTLASCAAQQPTFSAPTSVTTQKLASDLRVIQSLEPQLRKTKEQLVAFHLQGGWRARGYFNAEETEKLEGLLFHFVTGHTALWDIANSYGEQTTTSNDTENEVQAELLFMTAILLLATHTAELVVTFAGDPIAIKEINQEFHRSKIPFGTYDKMRESVTDPEKLQLIANLNEQYIKESAALESSWSRMTDTDSATPPNFGYLSALLDETESQLNKVAAVSPSYSESRRNTRRDINAQHKGLYKIRSVLFKDVSRLKLPAAHLITFSQAQKQQVYDLLEPGDLILTYTAGYMSSVFIPGTFKHGIIFIGTPEQRRSRSLVANQLSGDHTYGLESLTRNLDQMTFPNGMEADMIEAVAEGVIFNNLGHIMDTHINRMLILRPRLSEPEMQQFLLETYTYLGEGYDFRFDFADTTYQVCTELIYRALDGKGGIKFELTERAGHVTLSADDIVNYYLSAAPVRFDFVLYAEEKPVADDHEAQILAGHAGALRLKTLMP